MLPDMLDAASEQEMLRTSAAVAEQRAKSAPEQTPIQTVDEQGNPVTVWPHMYCVDCGDDIPEGRLRLGKIRCVTCQGELENKARRGRT